MSTLAKKRTRIKKPPPQTETSFVGPSSAPPETTDCRRPAPAGMHPLRAWHISANDRKWVNGTTLHYAFFNRNRDGQEGAWIGGAAQKAAVRKAFQAWKIL